MIDSCYRDCYDMFFRTFKYACIYNNEFRNLRKNEVSN